MNYFHVFLFLLGFTLGSPLVAMEEMEELDIDGKTSTLFRDKKIEHNPKVQTQRYSLLETVDSEETLDVEEKTSILSRDRKIEHNPKVQTQRYSLLETVDSDEAQLLSDLLHVLNLKMQGISNFDEKPIVKRLRYSAKGLVLVLGSLAGIPYFQPACKASLYFPILSGSDFSCYTFGTGTVIAYDGLVTWAGLRLANRIYLDRFEDKIMGKEILTRKHFLEHIVSNISGALACIPGACLVYKYNSAKWLILPATIVDYILKTEGYYTFIGTIRNVLKKSNDKSNMVNLSSLLNNILVTKIYRAIVNNEKNDEEVKTEALQAIKEIFTNRNDEVFRLLGTNYSNAAKYMKKTCQLASLIFPLGTEVVRVQLTNSALNYVFDSPYITIPTSCLISIPGFSLNALASVRASGALFDHIYKKVYHIEDQPNFMSYFFPKYNYFIYGISIILAALSTTGDAFVAYDTTSDSSFSSLRYLLPALIVMNNFLFQSFALSTLYEDIFMEGIKKFGTNNMKLGINITRAYKFAASIGSQISFSNSENQIELKVHRPFAELKESKE